MAVLAPPELSSSARLLPRGRLARALRSLLSVLWFAAIPALLAAVVVRRCVPDAGAEESGVVRDAIAAAQQFPLLLAIGLFLFFGAVVRHWRFSLPGWAYLANFPDSAARLPLAQRAAYAEAASLLASLETPKMRARLQRALDEARRVELDARLAALRAALETGDLDLGRDSARATRALAAPVLAAAQRREQASLILAVALAAVLAFTVRGRFLESYSVLSGSMLPTLQPADRLIGNRRAYASWPLSGAPKTPRRGDMIVFQSRAVDGGGLADAPPYLVKRVIGLPGDRISMHGGVPIINGWTVPYCDAGEYLYVWGGGENGLDGRLVVEFLEDRAYLTVHTLGLAAFKEAYEVKPGEVFVLGDNRNNSLDSRAFNDHHGGGVPLAAIDAQIRWFIASRGANKRWDFAHFFRPIDSLALDVRLEGVDLRPIEAGITKCLAARPAASRPPPPGAAAPNPPDSTP